MTALLVGIGISSAARPGSDPVAEALEAERQGYDFVSASDHPIGTEPSFETLTMLTWVAARTTRIGVTTRVIGTPFRRPAMLAKAAESLQRLSGGRLVLGLGAGHVDDEIVAVGAEPLTPGQKITGQAEAIAILRAGWSGQETTIVGRQHTVRGLVLSPTPVAPIPVWLGSYGPRALALTGRSADGWIPSVGPAAKDDLPRMLLAVRSAATDAGRDPDDVLPVLNTAVDVRSADTRADDRVAGTVAGVVDQLAELVSQGFRGFNLQPLPGQEAEVGNEVLPALRQIEV